MDRFQAGSSQGIPGTAQDQRHPRLGLVKGSGKLLPVADDVLYHTRAILPHTSVDSLDREFF